MEEAARRFRVPIEDLQWLAEEQLLPVYVRASTDPIMYAKLTTPRWEYYRLASDLTFCKSTIIDNEGNPVAGDKNILYTPGFPFSLIFLKPDELRLLDQTRYDPVSISELEAQQVPAAPETSDFQVTVSSSEKHIAPSDSQTPESYVAELRSNREKVEIIAVRLAEKFPGMTGYEYMKVLDPRRVQDWEQSEGQQGRPKQWYYYLKKQGERILIALAEDKL